MLEPAERKPVRQAKPASPPARSRAKKVSLTVDEGVLRAMKREAKRSKRTLSAEVTDAVVMSSWHRPLDEAIEF